MVRKLVSATVSAALCMLSVAPAMAQDYRFTGFDAPRGATATVNLRVPLGMSRQQTDRRMSYGVTLGYGQTAGSPALDGRTTTRAVNLADLRFNNSGELRNARVASFDLANLDRDRQVQQPQRRGLDGLDRRRPGRSRRRRLPARRLLRRRRGGHSELS